MNYIGAYEDRRIKGSRLTEMPDWFKLQNYECFEAISDSELWEELDSRVNMFKDAKIGFELEKEMFKVFALDKFNRIKKGSPLISKSHLLRDDNFEFRNDEDRRYHQEINKIQEENQHHDFNFDGQFVKPIKIEDVMELNELISEQMELTPLSNDEIVSYRYCTEIETHVDKRAKNLGLRDSYSKVHIALDIETATNEEILEEVKVLLDVVRKELDVPELKMFKKRTHHTNKLRDYKVMEILDLLFWEALSGCKINRDTLTRNIFINPTKGDTEFRQTIMPFIDKVTSNNYRRVEKK